GGGRRRVLGEDHPDTLTSMNNLAVTLKDLEEHADARRLLEQVLAGRRRVLGDSHPHTLDTFNVLADIATALGDRDFAAKLKAEAYGIMRRALPHPPGMGRALGARSLFRPCRERQGPFDERLARLPLDCFATLAMTTGVTVTEEPDSSGRKY
ncbi:MAG: tetratricopeptide repeat protein, partial [Alphaproteobacteria bacterium]